MKYYLILITAALFITGCSGSKSDYVYDAKPTDPKIEFSSNFYGKEMMPAHFKINTNEQDNLKCSNFVEVGYYFPETNMFILAAKNEELNVQVPADRLISIKGHHNVGGASSCHTAVRQFVAEKGQEYLVTYELKNGFCKLEVINKNTLEKMKANVRGRACTR